MRYTFYHAIPQQLLSPHYLLYKNTARKHRKEIKLDIKNFSLRVLFINFNKHEIYADHFFLIC